ncbi:phosphatase PAP2 family protein, partial [Frankia sp. AvcI1]
HRRHTRHYAQARWTLVATTLICLVGFFLFPTAPPRLLTGTSYTDTMSHFAGWGWWTGTASAAPNGLEGITNQYAALPSLHCAWSLWCGFLLVRFGRRTVTRILGVLYPAATFFVVMSTANHYLLDAVAGWMVLGVAAGSVALVFAWRRRVRATAVGAAPVPQRESPWPAGSASPAAVADAGGSGTAEPVTLAASTAAGAAHPRADPTSPAGAVPSVVVESSAGRGPSAGRGLSAGRDLVTGRDPSADRDPSVGRDPAAGPGAAAGAASPLSPEPLEPPVEPTAAPPTPPAEPASSTRAAPVTGRQGPPSAAPVPPVPAPAAPEISLRSDRAVRPDGARAV